MASRRRIANEDQYEALRDKGYDKETAARIANSGREASVRGGESPPYEEWTVRELYERARELDIEGRSSMTKAELIRALRDDR